MSAKFRIIICGAGIAGLCAGIALGRQGHEVIIFERAQRLSPVGASIHVPPNATFLLKEWGLLEKFQGKTVVPGGFVFRRYADSSVLARCEFNGENHFSTPYWSIKRAAYQHVLYEAALEVGCDVRLGSRVSCVHEDVPAVTIEGGLCIHGDLILIADGIQSALRQLVFTEEDVTPISQPMATYRAWAPIESVMATSRMEALLRERSANVWLGPGRHMIVYPAEGGRILSINGTYPSRSIGVGEWSKSAGVEEVQQRFHDFDPLAKEILSKAQDCKSWALAELPRLSRWTSKSGKVVLIGDAAHGMLQFLAQGAALATEDAGAIAECMRSAVSTDDIPRMTRFYERSRKWRCEKVQANARRNGEFIHVPDGEVQERRDRKLTGAPFPDDENVDTGPLLDHEFMAWLYGHNTIAHTSQVIGQGAK